MNGPYTVTGASWFSIIEAGSTHIVRCVAEARRRRAVRTVVRRPRTTTSPPGCATA